METKSVKDFIDLAYTEFGSSLPKLGGGLRTLEDKITFLGKIEVLCKEYMGIAHEIRRNGNRVIHEFQLNASREKALPKIEQTWKEINQMIIIGSEYRDTMKS